MSNDKNKNIPQALPDEALEAVSGGHDHGGCGGIVGTNTNNGIVNNTPLNNNTTSEEGTAPYNGGLAGKGGHGPIQNNDHSV